MYINYKLGQIVRAWDFRNIDDPKIEGRPDCYIEGEVTGFDVENGVTYYLIGVKRVIWEGQEEPIYGFRKVVRTPVNGTETFRKPLNRVELIESA